MNHKKWRFISYEFVLFLLLVTFTVTIGLINPAFFSVGTLFDVIRNQTIYILLALGVLPVAILGGFDISYPAVASLTTFFAGVVLSNLEYEGGIWLFYLVSIIFAIGVGVLIGWMIWAFKLSFFNFSLGVTNMISGFMIMISRVIHGRGRLPALSGWNLKWIVTVQSVVGRSGLHVSFILVVLASIGMHLFLRYTVPGRSIYALGSDKSVALRTGFDTKKIYMTVFAILGSTAAIAAVTVSGLGSGSFTDKYMKVYAMVIIGGASIRGGRGTVLGTLLGVLLVGLINQAMVYLRIPNVWWDALLGVLFILFTTYQSLESRLNR